MVRVLSAIFLFMGAAIAAPGQTKKNYDLVKDFGAKPDNRTDCYTAFLKAAAVISKAGGGTLNIPKGNYYIASYKVIGGKEANNVTDIIFSDCKGLTIKGNNSVIRINGNFIRSNDYNLPSVTFHYAYKNTVVPYVLRNCKDVTISDLTINGGVLQMKRQDGVAEGECYGIMIDDSRNTDVSSRILIKNVITRYFAADGIFIRSNGEHITINNCTSVNNARQGLSIVKGSNINVLNSVFDSTGFTGAYGWHAPGAGIDIENEFGAGKLKNVKIRNCALRSNKGFQLVTNLAAENVVVDSCFIADLAFGYGDGVNGIGIYSLNSILANSILFATIQVDLADQIYTGPVFQEITKNIIYSGHRGITSASYSRPVNITDNIFINLPKPQVNVYFPYIQNYNCRFNRNIVVTHADKMKVQAGQVTALAQNVIEANDNIWLMNGYESKVSDREQQETYYFPALNGSKAIGNQYFPVNGRVALQQYTFFKFMPKAKVDKLLANSLFTAYKQMAFDKRYLAQADKIRSAFSSLIAASK